MPDVLVALPNITVRILNLSKFHFFSVDIILWKDQVQWQTVHECLNLQTVESINLNKLVVKGGVSEGPFQST